MKGKLTDQPLAELIREISLKNLSGTLRLEHDRARTAVYFESGKVVFAASNLRTLRVKEYLTKRNLVGARELAKVGNDVSDVSVTKKLLANGTLTQDKVDVLFEKLVTDILRVALLWTEGSWEFNDRARLDEPIRISVDVDSLVREAAHRLPLKFVSLRFRNPKETISRSEDSATGSNFLPAESFILSRLDAPTRLDELVAISGLRELDAHRIIYGLALSGAVKREYWHNAFRADARGAATEPEAVISRDASRPDVQPSTTRWDTAKDESDLERFLARLEEATNYYEVMDLPPSVSADELKDSYYSLARQYHPDRFHLKSGTSLHTRLSSAFARITQAYETLTDSAARTAYDTGLERAKQFAESAPRKSGATGTAASGFDDDADDIHVGQAEYNFREGFGALQQNRINAAVNHLAAAARAEPNEARYRAYYGKALAANERTHRLAETEMHAAVKLEPSNAVYRTMLAELYFDLKFHRRAQTELERALSLDPNNPNAQNLQRKLTRLQKIG
jgi:curved DNA-binding protein CbpA